MQKTVDFNDDEIVTSVQEESDPVDDDTDQDEDNNSIESSSSPSNADAFSSLETAMEWFPTTAAQENQRLYSEKNEVAQCVRFLILHGSHSVFGYPNNRVSERCPVPVDSDKRCSTVTGKPTTRFLLILLATKRHGGTLNNCRAATPLVILVEGEERRKAPNHPKKLGWNRAKSRYHLYGFSKLRLTTGVYVAI
ncbi:uncharacterized protein TNCV_4701481 [Trichonephila clavipes]|nr:uncharacterized protein TNCV_4701481 [Trichonephila clavipes]